nr:hypothetical protein [Tanacetum cinerariifolium]
MIIDDLYNNFKIVKQEVKRTASSNLSSQNMDFVSSPCTNSTNDVYTAYGVSTASTPSGTASTKVSTASTPSGTASTKVSTASTPSSTASTKPVHEDFEQIHEDDLEEIDLKWQLVLLSMGTKRFFQKTRKKININVSDKFGFNKSKVECYNYHKIGYFARECRGPRNQDSRNSYMAEDEAPTNMALMTFSDSESKNASEDILNEPKESPDALLVKDRVSNNKDCLADSPVVVEKKIVVPILAKVKVVRPKQQEK